MLEILIRGKINWLSRSINYIFLPSCTNFVTSFKNQHFHFWAKRDESKPPMPQALQFKLPLTLLTISLHCFHLLLFHFSANLKSIVKSRDTPFAYDFWGHHVSASISKCSRGGNIWAGHSPTKTMRILNILSWISTPITAMENSPLRLLLPDTQEFDVYVPVKKSENKTHSRLHKWIET